MRKRQQKRRFNKLPIIVVSLAVVIFVIALIAVVTYLSTRFFPQKHTIRYIVPVTKIDNEQILQKDLQDNGLNVTSMRISSTNGSLVTQIQHGPLVYFSPQQDLKNQVSSLQLIISRLTIEKKDPSVVDFRYNKPIVKF